jgi:hypothetical protein
MANAKAAVRFEGVPPYIRRALALPQFQHLGSEDAGHAVRLDPVMRVQSQLSQAGEGDGATRLRDASYALRWRDVLALALAGVEAALEDFWEAHGLEPVPPPAAGVPARGLPATGGLAGARTRTRKKGPRDEEAQVPRDGEAVPGPVPPPAPAEGPDAAQGDAADPEEVK